MVDALILNYNDAITTRICLDNLVHHDSIRYVVVVDNASTDNSYDELLKYNCDKVVVVKSPQNGGYGFGNNFGIKYLVEHYCSEFILLTNPDVIIDNSAIEELENSLRKHSDYAIVAPFMYDIKGVKQYNTAFKIPNKNEYLLSLGALYSKYKHPMLYSDIAEWEDNLKQVGAVSGACFMMNADYFCRCGMFDENIFLYCEEVVLALKMEKFNLKVGLLPSRQYIHNHSVSINKSIKSETKKKKILVRSKIYVLKQYYDIHGVGLILAKVLGKVSVLEAALLSLKK